MNCCNSQHKTLRIVLLYLSSLISAMWSSTRALKALSVGVWAVQVVVQVDFHKKYCNGVSRCSWTNLLPTGLPVVLWLFCFIHSSSRQQIIPIWNSSLFAFVAQQLVAVTYGSAKKGFRPLLIDLFWFSRILPFSFSFGLINYMINVVELEQYFR